MELRKAVDNLCLFDPQFEADNSRMVQSTGGSTVAHAITSLTDVNDAIKQYTNVKLLVFNTHGVPGGIRLPNGLAFSMEFMDMGSNPIFLSREARILFLGCNVGEDVAGDKFIDKAGGHILKGKGGYIGATTVANFTLGWVIPEATMFGFSDSTRLKVRRFDVEGKMISGVDVHARKGFVN
jgi:hypothetical protein